jgi:outer membrane cobalamin receptor
VRDEVTLSAGLREQPLFGALVRTTLTAYHADIHDMILWSPDFRYIWSPHNFDVNRQGLEAELATRFPARNAELGLSGALNELTYVGPVLTGQVIYRPRWTASGHLDLALIGVRTGVLARYVGARRTGIGSELNQLPAFVTVDLHLSRGFRLGRTRLEVSGGVDNLFDERTSLLVDYPAPGRSWWLGTRLSLGQDGPASEAN